jgi:biopolymer transport protein ExbD
MAFGGFNQQGGTPQMSEINMVPLIDVMLVLLIVFMITAPLLTHRVQIDLPAASSQTANEQPDTLTLAIDEDGTLYWNDEPVSRSELTSRLADAAAIQPQPTLHLRADRETRYEIIAQVMSEARQAGMEKMGFVTVPPR